MTRTFVVHRNNLHQTAWQSAPPLPLVDGAVRLRIDAFALTSNNITYAAFGEAMNYWNFFPTGTADTGCIPVWGFGDVVESRCVDVASGERFYGYFPMATDCVLHPARVNDKGFFDGAAHRRELPAVYNQYTRCTTDPGYEATREAEQALLRPLFITSFLIDDMLADNGFFGARTLVLSSASSKTAFGTAFCLARRRGSATALKVIGLTSTANKAFTHGLGCYDEVLTYDEIAMLHADAATVFVDFSGNAALRMSIHTRLAEGLAYSCSVGATHWESLGSGKGLPGPRPVLFFAPAQMKKRSADGGAAGLQARIATAWSAFMAAVTDARQPWLQVARGHGPAALEATYAALLAGTVAPQQGHYIAMAG